MRLLYVSDYASWKKVSKGDMPSQHLFGIHELVDHYEEKNNKIRGILKEGGYVDFYLVRKTKLPKRMNQLWSMLDVFIKSFQYDLVYDVINQCTKILAILRKYKVMRAKLVSILHHPPFSLELKYGKADAYIFFDKIYYDYAMEVNPHMRERYYINEWYPDQKWYDSVIDISSAEECSFFADNGKTNRDHDIVEELCEKLKITCLAPKDEINYNSCDMMKYYTPNLADDIGMARRLSHVKAILIPVRKHPIYPMGPIGITSFLDAMALKMPVLCSDNCCFAHLVKQYGLGEVYEAGNKDNLGQQMIKLYSDKNFFDSCKKNMEEYCCGRSMEGYGIILKGILDNVVKGKTIL